MKMRTWFWIFGGGLVAVGLLTELWFLVRAAATLLVFFEAMRIYVSRNPRE